MAEIGPMSVAEIGPISFGYLGYVTGIVRGFTLYPSN